jgi:large subunit ribosomal protein L22
MQVSAKAKYIRFSPYKMRLLVNAIRNKNVKYALDWLSTCAVKRSVPIHKLIESAAANALHLHKIERTDLYIKEIKVDQGPTLKYFKPGAMGRSNPQRKRLCHMNVILESLEHKED